MKSTKKSLLASGLAFVVCLALLMGATFAWFTDSVTSTGNTITAGTLGIEATVAGVDADASTTYTIDGVNGGQAFGFGTATTLNEEGTTTIIQEDLWEPGQSNAKLLTVKNNGSLAAKVKLQFSTTDGGLESALWFDFLQVENNTVTGQFTERPMSALTTLADGMEISLAAGASVQYILVYGMNEEAGNEYQGKTFSADVTILATQDTVETDGFNNPDYDAGASYPATNAEELKTQLEQGGIVTLSGEIAVVPEEKDAELVPQIAVSKDTLLDLGNGALKMDDSVADESLPYTPALIVVDGATLTINGNGTIDAEAGYNNSFGINVNHGGKLIINGGTYYGAMTAVQVQEGYLEINGGFFDLAETIKKDAPNFSAYLINAIDENYNNGTAVISIKGGTFVNFDPSHSPETDNPSYVADGYKVISETQTNGEIWYTVVPE